MPHFPLEKASYDSTDSSNDDIFVVQHEVECGAVLTAPSFKHLLLRPRACFH